MKYKAYSRRKFGALLREWAGRNKGLMLWMLLGLVALLAFETVIDLRFIPGPARWYLLGLLHAGLCAAAAVLLLLAFFAHEGQAIFQMRGAWGEKDTRDEALTMRLSDSTAAGGRSPGPSAQPLRTVAPSAATCWPGRYLGT